jgi:hypothetical protein
MEADMLPATNDTSETHARKESASSRETSLTLLDRIHDVIAELSPAVAGGPDLWARGAGPHVLLGIQGDEAFARLTPLGGGLFGLSFRSLEDGASATAAWEPLLLIDELAAAVEHALVAVEAIVIQ